MSLSDLKDFIGTAGAYQRKKGGKETKGYPNAVVKAGYKNVAEVERQDKNGISDQFHGKHP